MANGSSGLGASRVAVGFALAAILGLAFAAYAPLLGLDHLGWDTWPLLVSARITSFGDLAGSFAEELMDGRYPHGDFYRPVLSLSVGFDGVWWGLRPFGYHLTDLLLLLLTCVAAFAAGRRLLGDSWAALAACALFALHPLHFESLPVTARRGDALAALFTLLALVSLPPRGAGRGLGAMLFAVLAVGSKETGVLAAPLLVVLAFAEGEGEPGRRIRDALRVAAPALLAVAVFLLLRLWVLGGLGGHGGSSLVTGVLRAPLLAWLFVPALLVPQPLGAEALGLALALGLAAALALVRRFEPRVGRACLVSGAWLIGLLLLSGISGDLAPWYAAALLPAYGLLYGALVAGALAGWR